MATITEDYVSFETAKLLKEKGFDVPCFAYHYVMPHKTVIAYDKDFPKNSDLCLIYTNMEFGSMPTLQMAMKWLREVHGITIIIDTNDIWLGKGNRFYWCKIYYKMGNRIEIKWYNDPSKPKDILRYQTYEQACEEAIKYCLEHLI